MNTKNPYHRHRFPSEIISHCVWLYYRFSLSYRDIELMMAERGLNVTYETIRYWCLKFGHLYAKQMRKRKVKKQGNSPRKIVTDKLASYRAPRRMHFPLTRHITDKWANNRAENSHQMTRVRERGMKKFKSMTQAQRFLSTMSEFYDHFQMNRHKTTAQVHRILLNRSLHLWRTIAQNPLIA